MDLNIGDSVFYTQSTGLRVPAKVVGHSDKGYVELEYHQDGVRIINHQAEDGAEVCVLCCQRRSTVAVCDECKEHYCNECIDTHTCGTHVVC